MQEEIPSSPVGGAPVWLQGLIIVGSMILSIILLCAVAWVINPAAAPDVVGLLRLVTVGLTIGTSAGAFLLGSVLRETTRSRVREGVLSEEGVGAKYLARLVTMAALIESPGILAGVVVLLGGGWFELLIAGYAVLALLIILPTPSRYERFLAYVFDRREENPYRRADS